MDFSKFDKMVDLEGLNEDLKEVEKNGSTANYNEVPVGNYEVSIEKLELGETSENSKVPGSPMLVCWFKIISGEYEGSLIFMNQVLTLPFQIHLVNEFLESLETNVVVRQEVFTYSGLNEIIMDIAEEIDGRFEFALKYGKTKKGFNTFKITEVFETE